MCTFIKREETDRNGDSTLVYGEITFKTLALALHKIKTKYGLPGVGSSGKEGVLQGDGGAFYDIGSGTGKPVRLTTCWSVLLYRVFLLLEIYRLVASPTDCLFILPRSFLSAATATTTVVVDACDFLCFNVCTGYRSSYLPFVRKGGRD